MSIVKALRTGALLIAAVATTVAGASAQTELSGTWAAISHEDGLERGAGPYAVDYTGLPLNDEGRARALSYSASQFGVIEHQCGFWPPHYLVMGPFGMKVWNQTDPVTGKTIAWTIGSWEDRGLTTIWMDGRPRPSKNGLHLRGGFTTGEWDGNTLVAYTTHIKAGAIRRNGAPSSDEETMTTRFIRHGDLMTVMAAIEDPVYLSEPYVITKSFRLNPDAAPMSPIGPPCIPTYEGTAEGSVPHILPGENPSIDELTTLYHIPRKAVLGGADTMYPEYRKTMKDAYVRPDKCPANCGAPPPPPQQAPTPASSAGPAAAQPRPDNPQSLAHREAAKNIAGSDPWLLSPYAFYCVAGNARGNNPNAPELDPVRLFDNVYAVGNSEATVYAITTSQGIILIDSGYADRVETVVIAGLKKLGLDPAAVKFILLGHGHADHFGGARYFQEHYGTKVGTAAADWDLIDPPNPPSTAPANQAANQAGSGQSKPKRDLVLAEGQPIRLGDMTVTPIAIPGHTPGSLAFIFPVRDGRNTHMAGLFGGTILTADRITTAGLSQYVQSIAHYLESAKKLKVDVEIQNHPIFDMTPDRLARLKTRRASEPHPFMVSADRYAAFWSVISECIQSEIARR